MADSILERRQILERRLARANKLEEAIESSCAGAIFDGLTLDQIDHDGVLRQCVKALVTSVGMHLQDMDVVISRGPHSPWGLRIVITGDECDILPVHLGEAAASTVQSGQLAAQSAPDAEFDFSKAAELAAFMWKDR